MSIATEQHDELLTTREVAEILGIHINNVGKAIKKGSMKAEVLTPEGTHPNRIMYGVTPEEVDRYRRENSGRHDKKATRRMTGY